MNEKEMVCPHCGKSIHTLYLTILKNIKRHFQEVKRNIKTLNYLMKDEE